MQKFLTTSDVMNRAELHAWNLSRDDVHFALFYIDGSINAYRDRIDDVDSIQWYDLSSVDEAGFYLYVCQAYTESDVAFFHSFAELSLVVLPPLVYGTEGWVDVTIVGRNEALTNLVETLEGRADVNVDIREIGVYNRHMGTVTGGLTDRQFTAIKAATEAGYYAVPRRASLAAVATELGVANSTASELLRRAESRLMPRLVNG